MIEKISSDDALLLAKELRSLDLDETTSAARFIESLISDAIFCEEWERTCSISPQLQFYGTLADAILCALRNNDNEENSLWEKAGQLLDQIEAHHESLIDYMTPSEAVHQWHRLLTRKSRGGVLEPYGSR
ncbi:MAG: hypothetical protein ABI171_18795 [Collimonas sp.]|uniref:hypothetical protein n=1 Tax=Collimonas sp. TaxID=1963772 RepID=UPI0032638D44